MTTDIRTIPALYLARIQSDAFRNTLSLVGQGKFVIIEVSHYVYHTVNKSTMKS